MLEWFFSGAAESMPLVEVDWKLQQQNWWRCGATPSISVDSLRCMQNQTRNL